MSSMCVSVVYESSCLFGPICAGCCFIKYGTSEEADRAIRALHNQHTLPGVSFLTTGFKSYCTNI